jgi:neurotransmitter:Na+ symporter, NSS family
MTETVKKRDSWGSRFGLIMAVAGSAIGLGNFLRFPAKVAANGGGAFMIPYLVSILLLGIPLVWIEWTLGRFGGGFGHGTGPGIFHSVWRKNRFIKYFGLIGIFGPLIIFSYYTFVESWSLAYSFYALTGKYCGITNHEQMQAFLKGYQGLENNRFFSSLVPAYIFFLITFFINISVIFYGIRAGISRFCKWALPLLLICAVVLMIRVFTLGVPNVEQPDWNVLNGLGFLWNPDFAALKSAKVWLEAAGQVFFSLSVGIGVILTYSSYISKKDDVVLSGLSAVSTNQFAEVILGGSIIIPAAFVFFGPGQMESIAASGIFDLGFVTMPMVINNLPVSALFGLLWFFLLFLAGVTSSVSLAQPTIAFLEDEFDLSRKKSVFIFTVTAFVLCQPAIFLLSKGVLDELDFWAGTVFIVLFATIETVLFAWVFKMEPAWKEMHKGADLTVPSIYRFIIKYVTPLFLLTILFAWIFQEWLPVISMKNVQPDNRPYIFGTRICLLILFVLFAVLLKLAWRRKKETGEKF